MMKKLMTVVATVMLVVHALAESEVVDGVTWYYEIFHDYSGGNTCARIISGAEKYVGKLTIPEVLGGYSVTSVGSYAFRDCVGLELVSIPSSVTSIGVQSFSGCCGLTSMSIPSRVTSIGGSAFSGCSELTALVIPSNVTSIGSHAFWGCRKLARIAVEEGNMAYKDVNNCLVTKSGTTLVAVPWGCSFINLPFGIEDVSDSMFDGDTKLQAVVIPSSVVCIRYKAFSGCSGLTALSIPSSVTSIEEWAFDHCKGLVSVSIPSNVVSIGASAFQDCDRIQRVEFLGRPPIGVSNSGLLWYGVASCPREYGAEWQKVMDVTKFCGYRQLNKPLVKIVYTRIRVNDPSVVDVVYKVISTKPRVKVRALAFQNGERSFAKVVRPTEFIEDTAKNLGDAITANEEHKLSWRVSADLKVELAEVEFEVLAVEEDLLPLELMTIPKVSDHAAMEISWNVMTEQEVFDALLWCYADGDIGLTLDNGGLKNGSTLLADGTSLYFRSGWDAKTYEYFNFCDAIGYVYFKMGFSVLSGDELKYANEMTRLGLNPSGIRQYAWRTVEE